MSHVAEVQIKVRDLDALRVACERVGLQFNQGQTHYKWYGRFLNDWSDATRAAALRGFDPSTFGKSQHAITVPGNDAAYGIGVVTARDGDGFELVYDAWSGGMGLEGVAGVGLSKLRDEYAAEITLRALARKGYKASRTVNERGQVQVIGFKA